MRPILWSWNGWEIPSYPAIISLGLCFILFLVPRRAMSWQLRREDALDAVLAMMIGAFFGARLFHVFFEHPALYWHNPGGMLMFWRGGFVFFGGLWGALGALWVTAKQKGFAFLPMFECLLPLIALGMFFGRSACFLAGCCYGKPLDAVWSVTFPPGSQAPPGVALHPTQLYLAAVWGAVMIACAVIEKLRPQRTWVGWRVGACLAFIGVCRFIVEFFRDDDRGSYVGVFSQAQMFSIVLGALGIWIVMKSRKQGAQLIGGRRS